MVFQSCTRCRVCDHTPGTEGKGGASGDEDLAHHLELETLEVDGVYGVF